MFSDEAHFDLGGYVNNEYGCVYVWTTLGKWACDRFTEDADFGKKIMMKLILKLVGM